MGNTHHHHHHHSGSAPNTNPEPPPTTTKTYNFYHKGELTPIVVFKDTPTPDVVATLRVELNLDPESTVRFLNSDGEVIAFSTAAPDKSCFYVDVPEIRQKEAEAEELLYWDEIFTVNPEIVVISPPNVAKYAEFGSELDPSMPVVTTKIPFKRGKHKIRVDLIGSGYTFCGLVSAAEKEVLKSSRRDLGPNWEGFPLFTSNSVMMSNNSVVMVIDMDKREALIGDAEFQDIPKEVFVAVTMKRCSDRVATLSRL